MPPIHGGNDLTLDEASARLILNYGSLAVSLIWRGEGIEETVISASFHGWKLLMETDFRMDISLVIRSFFFFK